MNAAQRVNDRFSISYAIWVGLLFLLFLCTDQLDRIFNLSFAVIPLLLLPAIGAVVAGLIVLVLNSVRRRWKRVASIVAAPFIAYSLFWVLDQAGINPDRIRLELGRQYYLAEVARLLQNGTPRFKMFDWGNTGGAAVANIFYTLVYDESDEITRPVETRSPGWERAVDAQCSGAQKCPVLSHSPQAGVTIRKIAGHFYLVTEVYQ